MSSNLTREQTAMAQIERSWEQWRSPNADITAPDGWRPVDDLATKPLVVDEVIARTYRVVSDAPVPLWRRCLRWLNG